jgi:hypothetical protein
MDSRAIRVVPGPLGHADEIAEPILGHGLGACDGRIYTSDRHGQLLQIDLATFTVTDVDRHDNGYGPIQYFCTDHPTIHAVVDHPWRILLGSLPALEFSTIVEVTTGTIQRVRYATRHSRFWAVQHGADNGGGLANGAILLSPAGNVEEELFFSRYALAFLEFSPTGDRVYAGGTEAPCTLSTTSPAAPRSCAPWAASRTARRPRRTWRRQPRGAHSLWRAAQARPGVGVCAGRSLGPAPRGVGPHSSPGRPTPPLLRYQ